MCGGCFRTRVVISIPRPRELSSDLGRDGGGDAYRKDGRPRPRRSERGSSLELGAKRLLWRSPLVISQFDAPTFPVYNIAHDVVVSSTEEYSFDDLNIEKDQALCPT